jgi:hypothetical protein
MIIYRKLIDELSANDELCSLRGAHIALGAREGSSERL